MPFDGYFQSLFKMAAKKPLVEFQQGVHTSKEKQQSVKDPKSGRT